LKAFDLAAVSLPQDHAKMAHRQELLEEAAERVYFVVIQREAMKLSGYEEFFTDYDITPEVRKRMGPKREK
jgi:hypothetical protein